MVSWLFKRHSVNKRPFNLLSPFKNNDINEKDMNTDKRKVSKDDLEKKMHKLELSKKELTQKLTEKKISALDGEIEQAKQGLHPLIKEKLEAIELKRHQQEQVIDNLSRQKKESIEKEYQSKIEQTTRDHQAAINEIEFSEHFTGKSFYQRDTKYLFDNHEFTDDINGDLELIRKSLLEKSRYYHFPVSSPPPPPTSQ